MQFYSHRHQERVQAISRKGFFDNRLFIVMALAIVIYLWGLAGTNDTKVLGLQATSDNQARLQHNMTSVCEHSARVHSGSWENACGNLIDQVQADGQHEVLSDKDHHFWTESK